MAQEEYIHWPTNEDVPLMLAIVDDQGVGVAGLTPEVSIRRYKEVGGGALLDKFYWDPVGEVFTATPTWITLPPVDAVELAGSYLYTWVQSFIGLETMYLVTYRHTGNPKGFATELHVITNEVYVPHVQPDPVIFGPHSIMGQLSDIKDGGTGDFDGALHSLAKLGLGFERVLGLLHHNAIADKQVYDSNGQMTSARLRVFDSEANVPAAPDLDEIVGLLQEYEIIATYAGLNNLRSYVLKEVL
jgi:hypothetical protein